MADIATRNDALRIEVASVEVKHLVAVGTIPGVAVLAAAARNGPGIGRLRSTGDGTLLSWKAVGSSTFGPSVDCSANGSYLLEDGEDATKWARVQVYAAHLLAGPTASAVYLSDVYDNAVGHDDVIASEASAGNVETYTLAMKNAGQSTMFDVRVWLDDTGGASGARGWRDLLALLLGWHSSSGASARPYIEISDDNITWVQPTDEDTGLAFGELIGQQSTTLYVRRTTQAGTASSSRILSVLHWAWTGF